MRLPSLRYNFSSRGACEALQCVFTTSSSHRRSPMMSLTPMSVDGYVQRLATDKREMMQAEHDKCCGINIYIYIYELCMCIYIYVCVYCKWQHVCNDDSSKDNEGKKIPIPVKSSRSRTANCLFQAELQGRSRHGKCPKWTKQEGRSSGFYRQMDMDSLIQYVVPATATKWLKTF